jgi:hypothetical protein
MEITASTCRVEEWNVRISTIIQELVGFVVIIVQ